MEKLDYKEILLQLLGEKEESVGLSRQEWEIFEKLKEETL